MKISYLMYDPVPDLAELSRRMAYLAELGYHGIELVATHPLGYPVEALAEQARRHGLPVVSLMSGWSYGNEGLCLSSPDARVRERAADRIADYVRLAAPLGALVVVGLMQGLRSDEPEEPKALPRIADGLSRAARVAEERNVPMVLEPVNHLQVGFNNSAAEAAAMVDRVGSPALQMMLDTIHMNIEERSVEATIRQYGGRLRHFHLCETHGGPLGTGGIDFTRVFAALREVGYAHWVSVKVYRKLSWEQSARSSIEFLREWVDSRS